MVKSSFPSGHKSWLSICSLRDLLQGRQSINDRSHLRLEAFLFFPPETHDGLWYGLYDLELLVDVVRRTFSNGAANIPDTTGNV